MIRLTRKVFTDLTIWMIGLGLLMGVIFPFFVMIMGIPSHFVMTPWFFAACMGAGFLVGATNIGLARAVVGIRLRFLASRMRTVAALLQEVSGGGDMSKCRPGDCLVPVDSDDELGESAQAFNDLVLAQARSVETAAAVRSFSDMLVSQLDVDVLADRALQQLLQHTNASAGAVLIDSDGEVKVSVAHGIRSVHTIVQSDHVRRALRTEERQSVLLPQDVVVQGVLTDFQPREVVVDPIVYKETVLGAIVLASGTGFSSEERNRLDVFRQGMALAFHNSLMYDRLERLAALDALTNIYNRRFGMGRLHEEFGRSVRSATPLSVLLFDIDHFKRVNDTYGHLTGDRVLALIAKVARSVIREGDVLVRYGGEEFLAILPGASKHDAGQVGERLRRVVEDSSLTEGEQVIHVTVSVGGAAYPQIDADSEVDLLKYADKAMYAAKESGRNRVLLS